MNPKNQTPIQNPLNVMQPNEQVICEIRRHPIGILTMYVGSGLLLVLIAAIIFGIVPNTVTSVSQTKIIGFGAIAFLAISLLTISFTFIANKVYWGNRWILTSDSLTQVSQSSLFDRQSSQLSLKNLEDVTAEQNGILSHMFNYGVLRVETAGERSKFMFIYCPNPNYYAQQVLDARERYEQSDGPAPVYQQTAPAASGPPNNPSVPTPTGV